MAEIKKMAMNCKTCLWLGDGCTGKGKDYADCSDIDFAHYKEKEMRDTFKFMEWQKKIEAAIENRIIKLLPKKAEAFEKGEYNPFFSLVDRDGELLCLNTTSRKMLKTDADGKVTHIGDVEVGPRFHDPQLGFSTKSKDDKSWEQVTLAVYHHFGLKDG